MFAPEIYVERRKQLKSQVSSGILFFPGNGEMPMNYAANEYRFRQDSNFLYYWGLDKAGLAAVIDLDKDKEILFGDDRPVEDTVWMGPEAPFADQAALAGVSLTRPSGDLAGYLDYAVNTGRKVHYLPPYRAETKIWLEELLGIRHNKTTAHWSREFNFAVIAQRSVKTAEEVAEIEKAIEISYEMNTTAMKVIRPGIYEREVWGVVEGITLSKGSGISFPIIFSVHGETLHNHYHGNLMKEGQIAVLDSGAESLEHYASDITRTFPVSGKFTPIQKDIYNIVLNGQLAAIEATRPGVVNKDVHLLAAKTMAEGLKGLGIMKGNIDEAVDAGAHALFFPHGLGHMIGLDVHDMENLVENFIGYDEEIERSEQFGLAYLRLGKRLQPGYCLTIEPGIYFIPELVSQWKSENKFTDFINYAEVEKHLGFGGVRIEDDILVTETGSRALGKPIPKTVDEVEEFCAKQG